MFIFLNNLHSRGINIFNKDFYLDNQTLLTIAILNGWFESVKFLFYIESSSQSNKASETTARLVSSLYSKDSAGNSCLHLAGICGNLDIFFYLVSKGWDLQQKNKLGKTPIDLAREYGNDHIIKFIKDNFESIINIS